ncbi:MAG: hypothetical protein D6775_13270 [Caldilineae bacterium]|nr:MAG: hypothetical protein D6775_13270 [Caldilineae bacterium]
MIAGMSSPRPSLLFLAPQDARPDRWDHFLAYFRARGYAVCLALADSHGRLQIAAGLQDESAISPLPPTVADAGAAPFLLRGELTPPIAALLAPSLRQLLTLCLTPPPYPMWIALGEQARLWAQLLSFRPNLTCHLFQGLDADLQQSRGWERVAHALRLWLERTQT